MVNNHWSIAEDGKITVHPPIRTPVRPWPMDMDYGYRFYFVVMGWVDYYRYTGDPAAIAHVSMQVNHMLDYTLTAGDYRPWPSFPISVPFEGDPYGHAKPNWIQLDLSAHEGLATLKAYQMVGENRWFEMAKHWGDLFAANCNFDPAAPPSNRYATVLPPEDDNVFGVPQRPGNVNRMTGGASIVVEFLDELIRLGYRGKDDQIVKARDRGLQYLRDTLLPAWTQADTWGCFFWDGAGLWQHVGPTDASARVFMDPPRRVSQLARRYTQRGESVSQQCLLVQGRHVQRCLGVSGIVRLLRRLVRLRTDGHGAGLCPLRRNDRQRVGSRNGTTADHPGHLSLYGKRTGPRRNRRRAGCGRCLVQDHPSLAALPRSGNHCLAA